MRDWSAFVHEGHLAALEDHLEAQGYIDSLELQRLFAAMRANDLIWSSVVNHYLLDKPAPPSRPALLVRGRRAHPGRVPQELQSRPAARQQAQGARPGSRSAASPIDLAAIETPMLVIALKDDHVSAWEAVYRGARDIGADFVLGGSGHNAGVINPPSRNKHGYWTGDAQPDERRRMARRRDPPRRQLVAATGPSGSTRKGGGKQVAARAIDDGIEPAPGCYAMMP